MNHEHSINALIKLVDDPDEFVFEHVRDKLTSYGIEAIPYLESSWEDEHYGLIFHNRIEQIIHEIQFNEVKTNLKNWTNSPEKDLLQGAIIIAKYQYPGLDETKIHKTIDEITRDIWLELNKNQTAFEQVKIFNRIFFDTHHFHGDSKNFGSPTNSFINTVIETKKGNPLSLSLLYSVIAQSLKLPIYGVNLPNHFVLAYMDETGVLSFVPKDKGNYGVLFYINPFSKGIIFNEHSIHEFLQNLKLPFHREYFEPCSNTAIIKRMLTNLIASFQQVGNSEKVEELSILRSVLD